MCICQLLWGRGSSEPWDPLPDHGSQLQDLAATGAEVWVSPKIQGLGRVLISFLLGLRGCICLIGMMLPCPLPGSIECPVMDSRLQEHDPVKGITFPHAWCVVSALCCLLDMGPELGKGTSKAEGHVSAPLFWDQD